MCIINSVHTEAINHDPAITFIQTGSQQPGRPSLGAWLSYGLGSDADDLPAFVVMISHGSGADSNQGLLDRLWGSGFLPSSHQGVKLRSAADPVLYLSDPPGIDRDLRRRMLDDLARLNESAAARAGRSGNSDAHHPVRAGLSHADLGAGPDRHVQRTAGRVRPVRPRIAPARLLRRQLPDGPPAGRTGRPLRAALPPRLGQSQRPAHEPSQAVQATSTSRKPP